MQSETPLHGRQHERAPIDVLVNHIVGDQTHLARTRDLSTGGASFYQVLAPRLACGASVSLEMRLPNSDDIIVAKGVVVRDERREGGDCLGLRFTDLSERDRQRIAAFVASHSSESL
jgi:c-di-GMP-binding flagellar brake protein YcgR